MLMEGQHRKASSKDWQSKTVIVAMGVQNFFFSGRVQPDLEGCLLCRCFLSPLSLLPGQSLSDLPSVSRGRAGMVQEVQQALAHPAAAEISPFWS